MMKRRTVLVIAVGTGLAAVLVVLALLSGGEPVLATAPRGVSPMADEMATVAPAGSGLGHGGAFLISTVDYDRHMPAIAYNPDDDQYLVVWERMAKVSGQVYSAQGIPQGDVFHLLEPGLTLRYPSVVYNTTHGQYLVVFYLGADIYGQIVSRVGVPEGEKFAISTADGHKEYPAVACNGADEYLVVWEDERDGNTDIYGQRVDYTGSLLDNVGSIADETDPTVNFPVVVSGGGGTRAETPDVAYNVAADEYLVVWGKFIPSPYDYNVLGQRVTGAGALQGGSFDISSAEFSQLGPAVAYAKNGEYLVVWADSRRSNGGSDIYGQRLGVDGSLLDNPDTPDIIETDPSINFPICAATWRLASPDVAFTADPDSELEQYLVVWQDERHESTSGIDIYGRRVGLNGTLAEQDDFALSRSVGDQELPAVAYSSGSHQYLAVWQDDSQGGAQHLWPESVVAWVVVGV